ncbi:MAG: hypothetical protein EA385_10695 [Salinarimonadaceae bacterium]|nr:MAG: hypothetical protein EA385_10695 [Salinarimonadaceae bacterium]
MAYATAKSTGEDDGLALGKLWRQWTDFADSKVAEIEEQRQSRRYYHGDQYTKDEIGEYRRRGQPVITSNRVQRKLDAVVGLIERMRQDPKAYPRTPQHEQGADLATATLRYTLDASRWDEITPMVALNAAINGIGVIELSLEEGDEGDPEIGLALVEPDTFFYDPRSFRHDFSDARYMGVGKWVDLEEAQDMFPDQREELENLISNAGSLESHQQQDRERRWINIQRRQVFIIEHWYRKGQEWRWCFYVGRWQKLAEGRSFIQDEKGRDICRFLAFSANVDHDGDRYGFVRNMRPQQDEINARRSKGLHLLNSRRIIMEKGAVDNVERTRTEWARADGVIERNPGRELTADQTAVSDFNGQLAFLAEAKSEIENFGPNPAVMGEGVENSSGRAISLLQQAGIAELGPFILAYRNWKLRVYRGVWNAVQQHWTSERWIRVTDDEDLAQFIQLNGLEIDEYGRPTLVNAIGSLDVDIIIDEGPDTVSLMMDTYQMLTQLASGGAAIPPDILIELAPLQSDVKKRILDRLRAPQEPDPVAIAGAEAQIGKIASETELNQARAMKEATTADAQAVQNAMSRAMTGVMV